MTNKTKIIGILNLTEDSFSDGQIYLDENKAISHIEKMINEGCKIIDINEIKNLESCYCLYPTVGENLDYINQNSLKNIEFLFRKLDQNSWKFCNKGFFNFKKYIPKIISSFS